VPTAPQIAKIDIVWYKFAQEGIPQKQFLQNVGLQLPKSQKNGNLWYKFAPKGKCRDPYRKT